MTVRVWFSLKKLSDITYFDQPLLRPEVTRWFEEYGHPERIILLARNQCLFLGPDDTPPLDRWQGPYEYGPVCIIDFSTDHDAVRFALHWS